MPVDPRKLKALVQVEKEVHRASGKTHKQKYWMRPGDVAGVLAKGGTVRADSIQGPYLPGVVGFGKMQSELGTTLREAYQMSLQHLRERGQSSAGMSATEILESHLGPRVREGAKELCRTMGVSREEYGAVGTVSFNKKLELTDTDGFEALGDYSFISGRIRLRVDLAEYIGDALESGVARGVSCESFRVLTHEMLHSVQPFETLGLDREVEAYKYEPRKEPYRPNASFEEATTEIIATQLAPKLAESLGVMWDGNPTPLFREDGSLQRATSYATWVDKFGRLIAATPEPADSMLAAADINERVAGWAMRLHAASHEERPRIIADRMFASAGLESDVPGYNEERAFLGNAIKVYMGEPSSTIDSVVDDFQRRLDRIVTGGGQT